MDNTNCFHRNKPYDILTFALMYWGRGVQTTYEPDQLKLIERV